METNKVRQNSGITYIVFGAVFFLVWDWLRTKSMLTVSPDRHDDLSTFASVAWCVTWAAFGIGAGLINTRDHNKGKLDKQWKHYFGLYYTFAWFMVSLLTLTISLLISGSELKSPLANFYPVAMSVALLFGFFAENLSLIANAAIGKLSKD